MQQPYAHPRLIEYGHATDLTLGGSGPDLDVVVVGTNVYADPNACSAHNYLYGVGICISDPNG